MILPSRFTNGLRHLIGTTATSSADTSFFMPSRLYSGSAACPLPMKPGTVLKSLGILKNEEPPVVKPREEYPAWVGALVTPRPTLAALRRMPNEEARDSDIQRFLKLSRRQRIRQRNEQSSS